MILAETLPLKGEWRAVMRDAASGRVLSDHVYPNVICTAGKVYIASWMNQEAGFGAMPLVFGATGTSGTAPVAPDVHLGAEIWRNALAINTRVQNVLTWSFFYNTNQSNATLAEAGIFLGGTIAVNSGSLLSHVLITEVKDSTRTLTLQWTLTIG